MITGVLLYLLLASLLVLILGFLRPGHTGPEGPVGAGIVFVPSLVLAGLFLVAGGVSGNFAWLAASPALWLLMGVGLLACLAFASFSLLDRGPIRWLGLATVVLIGMACFFSVHPPQPSAAGETRRLVTQVLIGAPALAGLAMLVRALIDRATSGRRLRDRSEREFQEAKREREARDTQQFAALPVDAPFFAVSPYLWSPTDAVRLQARARLARRPDLDAQLIDSLATQESDEAAARYIAYLHERPSATLAPAFAACLDRQLASWKTTRLIGPEPAQWEAHLSRWFEAAQRIQAAGGDLRASLLAWRKTLDGVEGLQGLARKIGTIA